MAIIESKQLGLEEKAPEPKVGDTIRGHQTSPEAARTANLVLVAGGPEAAAGPRRATTALNSTGRQNAPVVEKLGDLVLLAERPEIVAGPSKATNDATVPAHQNSPRVEKLSDLAFAGTATLATS